MTPYQRSIDQQIAEVMGNLDAAERCAHDPQISLHRAKEYLWCVRGPVRRLRGEAERTALARIAEVRALIKARS